MTIEYALTRTEIVQAYFRSLRSSPKFRALILLYSVGIGLLVLLLRPDPWHSVSSTVVLRAMGWAVGMFAFIPFWTFIRAKTATRTLTISPEGIYTKIGKLEGQVAWGKVTLVADAGQYILVTGRSGNSFFIPNRAFSTVANRDEFLTAINGWIENR